MYGTMVGAVSNANALDKRNRNTDLRQQYSLKRPTARLGRGRANAVRILGVAKITIEPVAGERWRCGWVAVR